MIDLTYIRDKKDLYQQSCHKRGMVVDLEEIAALDEALRAVQTQLQALQEQKNQLAKQMATNKKKDGLADTMIAEGVRLKQQTAVLEQEKTELTDALQTKLAYLPNLLAPDVPMGKTEQDNSFVKTWREPTRFCFEAKAHYEIGEALGYMDFESAVAMSGSRFVLLKGPLARLERALANFMLEIHTTQFGYQEVSPPLLVKSQALYGTGQLPKFGEDSFQTNDNRWLIPTAEVSLTNMAAGQIYEHDALPLRYVAYTPCFRLEAGAAGKDTRGMVRLHQFSKVELVSFVPPYMASQEHERMLGAAETILQQLELPYRVMLLCSGDTGFHSQKTYDLEVWLPAQKTYREISSCSYFGDYQARRLKSRYRPLSEGKKSKPDYIHTLNGSGLAVGRTLVALIENYQQADGSIVVPEVLRPYMGGLEQITP